MWLYYGYINVFIWLHYPLLTWMIHNTRIRYVAYPWRKKEEVYFELYTYVLYSTMNIKVNKFNANSISMILIFFGVYKK